jgi:hypothetical protein
MYFLKKCRMMNGGCVTESCGGLLITSCVFEYIKLRGQGRAMAQVVSHRLPTAAGRVRAQVRSYGVCGGQSWHWGKFFSEYFRFPCQFIFHRLLHIHHLSSGAGTLGQLVPINGRRTKWIQSH